MMNQKYKKLSAAALCGVMVLGLAGCGKAENTEIAAEQPMPLAEDDADLAEVLQDSLGISQTEDSDKDETVYVVADASGNSQQIIVSEWLKNTEGQSEIQDVSNLQDISNVKGDETFTQDGSSVTWAADGNPIYYQGTSDAQLPVGVEISYYLDGNQVTADEIAGQSGEVTIRFDYVNNEKSGDVYTPFVMATGLILSDENFSNVSVENGKVISDGSRSIVVGVGVPGLQESLGLEDEDIELPDYCEVSATATDFSLDMTVTFATTGLLGAIDEDADFSDVEDTVNDLLDEYQDGVNALADGIVEYTDGVGQIKDGADQLNDGAKKLYSGSVTLGNGVESAKNGTSQIKSSFEGEKGILSGSQQLSDGLNTLNQAVSQISLPDGQQELSADQKQAVVTTITNNITNNLTANQAQIAAGVDQEAVTAEAKKNGAAAAPSQADVIAEAQKTAPSEADVTQAATTGFQQFVAAYAAQTGAMPDDATLAALQAAYGSAYKSAYTSAYAAGYGAAYESAYTAGYGSAYGTAYQSAYGTAYVAAYKDGYAQAFQDGIQYGVNLVMTQVAAFSDKLDTLKYSVAALAEGANQLNGGLNQLYGGVGTLYNGMQTLNDGAAQLSSGAKDLQSGTGELQSGANELDAASPELVDGGNQLADATAEIADAVNDAEVDAEDFADTLKEIISAGNAYQSYGGISEDMTGNVKFIITTEAVKAE